MGQPFATCLIRENLLSGPPTPKIPWHATGEKDVRYTKVFSTQIPVAISMFVNIQGLCMIEWIFFSSQE